MEKRQHHQITKDDFDAWRQNIITKQLFEDLDIFIHMAAEDLRPSQVQSSEITLGKFNGIQACVEFVDLWEPTSVEEDR